MNYCPVCAGAMQELFAMPAMPLCEANDGTTIDQSFLYCEGCSHGRLGTVVAPALLYGKYAATSKSIGSSVGVANFASFVKSHVKWRHLECVVDIGGNDGSLTAQFQVRRRILVDPNASGETECIKAFIDEADLSSLKDASKLMLCSHTLEHIAEPEELLRKLQFVMRYDDYAAFQFPSLELLVQDCRIDQIYHQHVHYYSFRSASLILARYGFQIVAHEFDASHYGALMIVFRKGLGEAMGEAIEPMEIQLAHGLFTRSADALNDRLSIESGLIGYGASQMLPLLHYYLPALSSLEYIVDEDAAKEGTRYAKPALEVRLYHDMAGKSVVVTAFNTKMAVRAIVKNLIEANARDVIVPFTHL